MLREFIVLILSLLFLSSSVYYVQQNRSAVVTSDEQVMGDNTALAVTNDVNSVPISENQVSETENAGEHDESSQTVSQTNTRDEKELDVLGGFLSRARTRARRTLTSSPDNDYVCDDEHTPTLAGYVRNDGAVTKYQSTFSNHWQAAVQCMDFCELSPSCRAFSVPDFKECILLDHMPTSDLVDTGGSGCFAHKKTCRKCSFFSNQPLGYNMVPVPLVWGDADAPNAPFSYYADDNCDTVLFFSEAREYCESSGMRLCQRSELQSRRAAGGDWSSSCADRIGAIWVDNTINDCESGNPAFDPNDSTYLCHTYVAAAAFCCVDDSQFYDEYSSKTSKCCSPPTPPTPPTQPPPAPPRDYSLVVGASSGAFALMTGVTRMIPRKCAECHQWKLGCRFRCCDYYRCCKPICASCRSKEREDGYEPLLGNDGSINDGKKEKKSRRRSPSKMHTPVRNGRGNRRVFKNEENEKHYEQQFASKFLTQMTAFRSLATDLASASQMGFGNLLGPKFMAVVLAGKAVTEAARGAKGAVSSEATRLLDASGLAGGSSGKFSEHVAGAAESAAGSGVSAVVGVGLNTGTNALIAKKVKSYGYLFDVISEDSKFAESVARAIVKGKRDDRSVFHDKQTVKDDVEKQLVEIARHLTNQGHGSLSLDPLEYILNIVTPNIYEVSEYGLPTQFQSDDSESVPADKRDLLKKFFAAIFGQDYETVEKMAEDEPKLVAATAKHFNTALGVAIHSLDSRMAMLLCDHGAKYNHPLIFRKDPAVATFLREMAKYKPKPQQELTQDKIYKRHFASVLLNYLTVFRSLSAGIIQPSQFAFEKLLGKKYVAGLIAKQGAELAAQTAVSEAVSRGAEQLIGAPSGVSEIAGAAASDVTKDMLETRFRASILERVKIFAEVLEFIDNDFVFVKSVAESVFQKLDGVDLSDEEIIRTDVQEKVREIARHLTKNGVKDTTNRDMVAHVCSIVMGAPEKHVSPGMSKGANVTKVEEKLDCHEMYRKHFASKFLTQMIVFRNLASGITTPVKIGLAQLLGKSSTAGVVAGKALKVAAQSGAKGGVLFGVKKVFGGSKVVSSAAETVAGDLVGAGVDQTLLAWVRKNAKAYSSLFDVISEDHTFVNRVAGAVSSIRAPKISIRGFCDVQKIRDDVDQQLVKIARYLTEHGSEHVTIGDIVKVGLE